MDKIRTDCKNVHQTNKAWCELNGIILKRLGRHNGKRQRYQGVKLNLP
jgi:hypothetical protein